MAYVSSCDWEGHRFNDIVPHRVLNRIASSGDFAAAKNAERQLSLQPTLPILSLSLSRQLYFRQADLVHWSRVLDA